MDLFETDLLENEMARHEFGGGWTVLKLDKLESYLSAFTLALSGQKFKLIYIDAFAGTGRTDVTLDGEQTIIEGSAYRALNASPSFQKYYFIDKSSSKVDSLKKLVSRREQNTRIIRGDANIELGKICSSINWQRTRAVLFLDPKGMQVEWSTLEVVAQTGAIDVWYLFPLSAFYRQASIELERVEEYKKNAITRMLGTEEWIQAFYDKSPQLELFGAEREIRLATYPKMLEFVSERLKTIFPVVKEPRILYKGGDKGQPLFALYFAVSHPDIKARALASRIAGHILRI